MRIYQRALLPLTNLLGLHKVSAEATPGNATFGSISDIQPFGLNMGEANATRRAPVISISHGGGPMPILGDPGHAQITKTLQTRVPQILKLGTSEQPKAIVLVTAHWSTDKVTISSGARHSLLYDYHGFPPESYQIRHDAPGSPEVASEVERVLKQAGIACEKDATRGWDHGVFIPMKLIDPAATVPIVQVSVLASESPAAHYAMGLALSSLREQNVAIIGSGFATMHNLRTMFSGEMAMPSFKSKNIAWSEAVTDAATTLDVKSRGDKFDGWRKWADSYMMHPRGGAEHFLPLIVSAGAGAESQGKAYSDEFMGLDFWSYYWE